ncbi:MAG: hypothetical protein H0U38_09085 [Chloroflexia bacterium]|nr:hypothetical protein [Chloroflexia bacterium]
MRKTLMSFLVILLMIPSITVAQQPPEPVGTVTSGTNEVFRAYNNPDVDMDALAGVLAFGSISIDETTAASEFGSTAETFVESLRDGLSEEQSSGDYQFGELEAVGIGQIGDESSASLLPFTLFGTIQGEYGIVAVRQGASVQTLVGFGVGEADVIPDLLAIATTIEGQWPSEDPIIVREDGLRTGGIWDMMPLPGDLPDGFEIDVAFEEGPAAQDDIEPTGASTADAGAATPVGDGEEPGATPALARKAPLITSRAGGGATPGASPVAAATPVQGDVPTSQAVVSSQDDQEATPVASPAQDTEPIIEPVQSPTPTPVPEADVTDTDESASTDDMHERLARPFDLSIDIIIAQGSYTRNDDGSCSGSGMADSLAPGGDVSVQDSFGNDLAVVTIEDTGRLNYDTVLTEDVCYWRVTLPDVTAREEYVLATGGTVIGQFRYEDLATGEPGLVVIGADDD